MRLRNRDRLSNALSLLEFSASFLLSMSGTTSGVTDAAVRDELGRVLSSPEFAQSESLKRFLRHVVEATLDGRGDELKETILGASVFERGDDYDPRLDPIVRVQATRLRSKLREYYHARGRESDDTLVIELPKGSYVPVFRGRDAESEKPHAAPRGLGLALAIIAAAVVVNLVLRSLEPDTRSEVQSLVVLPFTDMSPDGDHSYYGDGLAEEITTTLAGVDGLRVVPRTTAFTFRDTELGAVGGELAVDAVLQGSVRKSGETLRIAAQLIRVDDGSQIWNEVYEEGDGDAFQVQAGIARSVAVAIEKELGVSADESPTPYAYEAYLKGRYELSRTTPGSIARAILLFEQAIEADPDYAAAHAGLVQAYVVNVVWGFAAPSETRELAREAAELALALDGDHEEAFAAAAAYELIYEWNMSRAQQLLERANDAGIRSEEIFTMQGVLLTAQNRLDEAKAALEESIARAPNVPFVHYLAATVAFHAGRYDEALQILAAVRRWAPDYILVPAFESRIHLRRGEPDQAATALDEFESAAGDTPLALSLRGLFDATTGRETEARTIVEKLRQRPGYTPPAFIARVLIALGEYDAALSELERAARERSLPVLALVPDSDFDPIRDDARFAALADAIRAP